MKNLEECKVLINELIDLNIHEREIARKIGRYFAEDGVNENLMSALENYLEKSNEEADSVRALYIAVENFFADDVLKHAKRK